MTKEKTITSSNGLGYLFLILFLLLFAVAVIIFRANNPSDDYMDAVYIVFSIVVILVAFLMMAGFYTIEPNFAVVILLFGKYIGTDRSEGFHWANPFYSKKKLSLRTNNFDSQKLKVNDKKGNPIEISVVVVWRVNETAEALFAVEDYKTYTIVQSESAIRHIATLYPYDVTDDEPISLRSSIDEVSLALAKEIQERIAGAGIIIEETRINHLAYAPEIAHAMLQRQQAEAVIAARTKIVDGAVGMVEMALKRLSEENVIQLDEERKAAMVGNLMVVLCSDRSAQPIINSGSLY
ncbi:MAG: SPFH domain-containing protein [Ignavibacteriales bacterium]|nr:SPFH domain-containing protein [Ignavibacteriales bacterium]MBK7265639.1 SPFH domain-containing protein [Ignavibacteriales bacterium]MBK8661524.1 SPFH domain-containing protein [Ignavibacteriales bacterium]MBP7543097.1 SPFH domain-containing protein [Ignavibacteriaceae bacterium]MCC6636963.1 SPFH domain-containing protein [Ignavibacteriaceae bacterium]